METATAPIITLQHDWEQGLTTQTRDVVWVSSSTYDNQTHKTKTTQGEITFVRSKDGVTASSSAPFSVSVVNSSSKWLSVQNTETNTSTDVFAPTTIFRDTSKKPIYSLGLSPQGGLGVFGSEDGILRVCDTQDGSIRRNLEGHKGDVTYCGFFPSGQVVLSGALDWRLKIWNLATGDCAATLTGHAGSVLGATFVERGRNILSCSRDGTANLWDVPTQTVIYKFLTPGDPGHRSAVNECCVFAHDAARGAGSGNPPDAREVATDGKVVGLAGEDGNLRVFDLRHKDEVTTLAAPQADTTGGTTGGNAFNCVSSSGGTIVGGSESGHIVAWDLRTPETPLHTLRLTSSPIKRLSFSAHGNLWAATREGATVGIRWDATATPVTARTRVSTSLTGSDFEPINGLGVAAKGNGTLVATGARDGTVRFYNLHE